MTPGTRRDRRSPTVADLMRRDVVSVRPDASVQELARLLRDECVTGVPVVEEDGTAVGTVSMTDLLWLLDQMAPGGSGSAPRDPREEAPGRRTVREVMTPDVFGVPPEATLPELLAFFSRTGLHRALVLEEGVVVGIVSVRDLLGLIAGEAGTVRAGGP